MRRPGRTIIAAAALLSALLPAAAGWTHLRGPAQDGRLTDSGLFGPGEVALEVRWRVPLGSGYSGIVASEGRGVTMFAAGERDVMAAFALDGGRELWRVDLGPTYEGHDGSDDGPLSTPVIADGVVYGLGPKGTLVAVRLADGETLWSTSLPDALGAPEPDFGFTTTPVVAGELLVVLTGGEAGSIVGLDRATGERRWSTGDGAVEYQSPTLMTLGGREQLVAVSGTTLRGLDPADGRVVWSRALPEDAWTSSSTPAPAGEDRLLLFAGGEMHVFTVTADEGEFSVAEAYTSKELGGTYALPVYHDGHLYGFKRQFLTCIDAATGERRWKSRPPGGRGLVLVDDRLVVFGAEGTVVVARATPAGYEESARVQALGGSGYTWPSVAGGHVLVRNLEEMAAVAIATKPEAGAAGGSGVSGARAALPAGSALASLVERVEALSRESTSLVERFLESHETFPVVENGHAHFVWRGDADDVAIEGTMIPTGLPRQMTRLPGTDLHYAAFPVEPGARHEYRFVVDFDRRESDPRNPLTVPGRWGDALLSELRLPGHDAPAHLAEPSGTRGTVERFTWGDEETGEREIAVWLPPGHGSGRKRYPLLVVFGTDYLDKGLMANTLDNLVGRDVQPLVVAFVPPHGEWWTEAGGARTEAWVETLATDLVPELQRRYRLRDEPSSRALLGFEGFGLTAAYAAARRPDVFGKAAAQSPTMALGLEDELFELLAAARGTELTFYVDWNRFGGRNVDQGQDLAAEGERMMRAIDTAGHRCLGGERIDAHGWGSRRATTGQVLTAFFPAR